MFLLQRHPPSPHFYSWSGHPPSPYHSYQHADELLAESERVQTFNRRKVGETYVSNPYVAPRKKSKQSFSKDQVQGKILKKPENERSLEFILNNFQSHLELHTVIVGDSIVDNICIDNCLTIPLSGGRVEEFYEILDTVKSYRNVILAVGGNNLSLYDAPGELPEIVIGKIRQLYNRIKCFPHRPKVIVSTVLKMLKANHHYIERYNSQLMNSEIWHFKLHQDVCSRKCFKQSDGIHLTEKGFQELACAFNKCMRENGLN